MTFTQQAASMSRMEVANHLAAHAELQSSHTELEEAFASAKQQLDWFKRQLFGAKSERRMISPGGHQLWLGQMNAGGTTSAPIETTVLEHKRRVSRPSAAADEERLRFDDSVPVETVMIPNIEVPASDLDQYTVVGEKCVVRSF